MAGAIKAITRNFVSNPLQPTSAEELLQHLLGRNKDLAPLKATIDTAHGGKSCSSQKRACALL